MVDGTWSGTMCLTEAHCGTDLGMLRTKAVPQEDGSYKVTGSKIFISAGEHDLTENIIHLVLARLPDAPPGIKGISLFLVPKFLPDERGGPGARNGVVCTAIEHKMGIKASATCQMSFDDATGWLVGEPHKGMRAMFTMMNSERLSVGVQGLGAAEAAYQGAVFYAKDRIQGRSLSGAKDQSKAADPIIVHPDVRRMLMTMRAYTEGCRALRRLGGAAARPGRPLRRPGGARRGGGFHRADDADRQGAVHRSRLRDGQHGHAGLWRPRLHPRPRHGAVRARRPHLHDLRGHQRHPGAGPGRPQDARQHGPLAAPLLPPGQRVHRGQPRRRADRRRW